MSEKDRQQNERAATERARQERARQAIGAAYDQAKFTNLQQNPERSQRDYRAAQAREGAAGARITAGRPTRRDIIEATYGIAVENPAELNRYATDRTLSGIRDRQQSGSGYEIVNESDSAPPSDRGATLRDTIEASYDYNANR